MKKTDIIGKEVINKKGEIGTIIGVDNHIEVDFRERKAKYQEDALIKGFLRFTDARLQEEVDKAIQEDEAKKAKEAEELIIRNAKAAKKEETERKSEDRDENKKNELKRPHIAERRRLGKKVIFMVSQGDNYVVESNGRYIWAPAKTPGVTDHASHAEMDFVKEGDIIFHHFNHKIHAISIAITAVSLNKATPGHSRAGVVGRYIKLSYHFLDNPAETSHLKSLKAEHGSMKYGPFDKNGNNKQGFYLSELDNVIADAFIRAAIAANPTDKLLPNFSV